MKAVRPGTLSTWMVPRWAATTAYTMDRPRPVLPAARERELSPRAKRSKIFGSSSGGMPGPASTTHSRAWVAVRVTCTVTAVPSGVCVRAFASRLAST